jgi:hypothetical protein
MLLLAGTYAEPHANLALNATGLAQESADGQERRRGLRIRQRRPVKVFEPAARRYYGGRTEDISSTGLRIELPLWACVQPGEEIAIHVGLNRKGESLAHRRQMITARVVWVNRTTGKQARLEAGVEFLASIAAHLDAA